ncbi:TetR family transcriptional regulator [Nonomuraea sp. NPDC059007]|uniref:TetR family transcriptional regulator n=1 Tax=Nonomuraea sp. NPDC059007 TaxID=3346692 RepID=UPI00367CCF46
MRDVAREAGVAVPTVYAAYQNKAGLVWALADAADLAADLPQAIDELEATTDPRRHLAAMAGYDRRLSDGHSLQPPLVLTWISADFGEVAW